MKDPITRSYIVDRADWEKLRQLSHTSKIPVSLIIRMLVTALTAGRITLHDIINPQGENQ